MENLVITLRVMDGSPENNSLVFEIARFAAGSINLPTLKMSSSVSLNFRRFSTLFLLLHYQNLSTQNTNLMNLNTNIISNLLTIATILESQNTNLMSFNTNIISNLLTIATILETCTFDISN